MPTSCQLWRCVPIISLVKIQPKVFALLMSLFAVFAVAQYFVEERILLPSFRNFERQGARQDMDRVAGIINREMDTLGVTVRDWGNWVETWNYMRDRNAHYIEANLSEGGFVSLQINALALYTTSGRAILSVGRESGTHRPIDIDLLHTGRSPPQQALLRALRLGRPVSGFVTTDHGPMLFVLSPILNGHEQGPFRGMVLMGKLITAEAIARIGEQARVHVTQMGLGANSLRTGLQHEELVEHETVTEIYRDFPDIDGGRAFTARIDVPRTISARGREVVRYASASVAAIGAVILVLVLWLLHRSVLSPLAGISRHMVSMGGSDDLSARLNLQRKDEFGDLAREFDRMVGNLADARRRLLDRSYEAGSAENARGVLHNLGNAMTPLCVNVADLQDILREAPTADIETAFAELENGSTDGERAAALQEFLRLACRELAACIATARGRVDNVVHSTTLIQSVIASQGPGSRATPALEPVRLPEFLSDSVTLVSPELRARLAIELDPSVRTIGEIWLARISLQQVVQNLIVNAAEAVRESGAQRGNLRINARTAVSAAGETLTLSFTDDGAGIAADNVGKVFDRGFSTKSDSTNSGIGLHWCANTLTALGGGLRVESAGRFRGATFHLSMPLLRATDSARLQVA